MTNTKTAEAITDKSQQQMTATDTTLPTETAVDYYKSTQNLGMKGIPREDIRPPALLLVNAMSNKAEMKDAEGKMPQEGQYYHTGLQKIYDAVDCHIIWANKVMKIDKRKPQDGKIPHYQVVGYISEVNAIFGMTLKRSSLYALSKLLTTCIAQQRAMFTFRVRLTAKLLTNKDGSWYVQAIDELADETNMGVLYNLQKEAEKYDTMNVELGDDEENTPPPPTDPIDAF